jgi:hypothetical protein
MMRKGYAKKGSGICSPQDILAAVIVNRIELATPTQRTRRGDSLGILIKIREVAHKAAPAANAGTLPVRPAGVPDSITASPTANTKDPAATKSFFLGEEFQSQ